MAKVAALYIDPRGPYPKMLGPEMCWDADRDARFYFGPHPVVAHPPCGPWGRLRHLYRGNEHDCAPLAIEQVRRYGGVLEHPAGSKLFGNYLVDYPIDGFYPKLPLPGEPADEYGGFTVELDQCDWGHVARKRTWLYCVGVNRNRVLADINARRGTGTPTHWTSGGRTSSSRKGSPVPPGIKVCSAQQRRRTPEPFARWLISLAEQASKTEAA